MYKEKIIDALSAVKRDGIEHVIEFLQGSDFFTAPASTKYHLSRPGGLAEHSWNVYECLKEICERKLDVPADTIAICGLLHDICKTNFYITETKRAKVDGAWVDRTGYGVKDELPLGHGEKSVILLQRYIALSPEEMLAVRWHMGPWSDPGNKDLSRAMDKCKLVKAMQLADMTATWMLE